MATYILNSDGEKCINKENIVCIGMIERVMEQGSDWDIVIRTNKSWEPEFVFDTANTKNGAKTKLSDLVDAMNA